VTSVAVPRPLVRWRPSLARREVSAHISARSSTFVLASVCTSVSRHLLYAFALALNVSLLRGVILLTMMWDVGNLVFVALSNCFISSIVFSLVLVNRSLVPTISVTAFISLGCLVCFMCEMAARMFLPCVSLCNCMSLFLYSLFGCISRHMESDIISTSGTLLCRSPNGCAVCVFVGAMGVVNTLPGGGGGLPERGGGLPGRGGGPSGHGVVVSRGVGFDVAGDSETPRADALTK